MCAICQNLNIYLLLLFLNKNNSGIRAKHKTPKILNESINAHNVDCFIIEPYKEYCAK